LQALSALHRSMNRRARKARTTQAGALGGGIDPRQFGDRNVSADDGETAGLAHPAIIDERATMMRERAGLLRAVITPG
jgi:hypothetical protein